MAIYDPHNQTQFSAEEPFFEQPVALPQSEVVIREKVPFWRRRKTVIFLIITGTALLLLILFGMSVYIENRRRIHGEVPVEITPPPAPSVNEYTKDVDNLRIELKAADPAEPPLQVPNVDYEIRLDERKN